MNRLTVRYSGIHVGYKNKYNNSVLCSEMTVPQIRECMEKLAAYEDTGLEPEEVKQLNASDVSKEESSIKYYNEMRKYRDELKYYKKLEAQGLLIKLPCKVGDVVYEPNDNGFIYKYKIKHIKISEIGLVFYTSDEYFYDGYLIKSSSIGKTVFLTREEAEKTLEDK